VSLEYLIGAANEMNTNVSSPRRPYSMPGSAGGPVGFGRLSSADDWRQAPGETAEQYKQRAWTGLHRTAIKACPAGIPRATRICMQAPSLAPAQWRPSTAAARYRIDCAVHRVPRLMSLDAEAGGTLELLLRPLLNQGIIALFP
jgi:hypothetical protein